MKTLNYQELVKLIEPGKNHPVLINTLPNTDFLRGHIPGSINIPAEQIPQKASQLFGKHDWIVVYCANQKCEVSHKAAELLEKSGFTNVYRFVGGLEEWTQNSKYTCTETPKTQAQSKRAA